MSAHRLDDGSQHVRGVPNQRRTDPRLHAVNLVVNSLAGNPQDLGVLLVGGIDRGPDLADDHTREVDETSEKSRSRVLILGDFLEECVDDRMGQGVFDEVQAIAETGDFSMNRSKTSLMIILKPSVGMR